VPSQASQPKGAEPSAEERYLLLHNAEVARRDSELKAQLERQGYVV
jgi:hypothetical protein